MLALAVAISSTSCRKTPFEKAQALAQSGNPRWLVIEIDTTDARRTYRESETISIVTRYSSDVRYVYRAEIAEGSSVAAATDVLHLSGRGELRPMISFICCDSRLIGLGYEPYVHIVPLNLQLKPGVHELYLTTRRVFPWSAGAKAYHPSDMEVASNLLTLRILPDPGWQNGQSAVKQQ